jgi:hypothetical protein
LRIIIGSILTSVLVLVSVSNLAAQPDSVAVRKGVVRGIVISAQSKLPVPKARIIIESTKLGAVANVNGEYRIENVPVGHYLVKAQSLGFSPLVQEVIVTSAHQTVLNFELVETAIHGDSIIVSGNRTFDPINSAAVISATPFTIQDVNRYAAAFQDPSRMAENFAGVYGRGTTNNYIVVRGGSPIELLWCLDGIEVPNPNHFGKNGSSGGLVSTINTSMLGNSDFLTGAFPAQYGTKLSAVFDLHTRDGNSETVEGSAQLSFNGMEAMAEGPIPVSNGSSFLVSFRHSTLSFLHEIGLLDYDELPDFDDAMAKLHLVVSDRDNINATGLWGNAKLKATHTSGEEIGNGSKILVGGLNWQHLFTDDLISNIHINHVANEYNEGLSAGQESVSIWTNTVKAEVNYTPISSLNIEGGFEAQRTNFVIHQPQSFGFYIDAAQRTSIYQAYLNGNWHIIPEIVLNAGLYHQYVAYDSGSSYEPRVSLAWSPSDEHSIAVAFGLHRQPEPLRFATARHYIVGYTYRPSSDVLFKVEAYQKDYSDVPIHEHTLDDYSFLNVGYAERIHFEDLINKGKGKAYGAEFTFLKHYADGYYVTATTSYIRQQFAGSDGIMHWGTFDNIYILNLLGGYDFQLSPSSLFTLSEKFTIAGGGVYTPFDNARSDSAGYGILDSARAFSARNPPYIRLDVNAEFHFNWSKTSMTIYASILNALNIQNIVFRRYQFDGQLGYEYDLPIIPILGIRLDF